MPKFYPTKPTKKGVNFKNLTNKLDLEIQNETIAKANLTPLTKIQDNAPYKKQFQKFTDEFVNSVANIGINNSLMQYSEFVDNRISYAECAFLKNQHYINNALTAYCNDLVDKKGRWIILDEVENADEILKELEKRLNELRFWEICKKAIETSFIFGGALVFLDSNTDDYLKPFYKTTATLIKTPLQGLKVIEPYLCSPFEVNTTNPLNSDYMKPKRWYISGCGAVDSSRIKTLIFNEAPDLIKPIYNFLGISKVQEMKDSVKRAETLNQANADIALRFRTMILKSPLITTNESEAISRAKFNNKAMNNLGLLLLADNEEFIETITPLTGLDRIQDLALQDVVASAYIPRNKLLGDEPSGFSSGEFTIKNYYDTIESLQNTILKPFIIDIAQIVLYGLGFDYMLDFEFEPVAQENAKEKAERENLLTDKIVKLYTNQIIDGEQAFKIALNDNLIPKNEAFAFDSEADKISESESENLINEILENAEVKE